MKKIRKRTHPTPTEERKIERRIMDARSNAKEIAEPAIENLELEAEIAELEAKGKAIKKEIGGENE